MSFALWFVACITLTHDSDTAGRPDSDAPPDRDGDGFVEGVDCDDTDASVHPGAVEDCNLRDDDCDGVADDGFTHRYADADGDGLGDAGAPTCGEGVANSLDGNPDVPPPGVGCAPFEPSTEVPAYRWRYDLVTDEGGAIVNGGTGWASVQRNDAGNLYVDQYGEAHLGSVSTAAYRNFYIHCVGGTDPRLSKLVAYTSAACETDCPPEFPDDEQYWRMTIIGFDPPVSLIQPGLQRAEVYYADSLHCESRTGPPDWWQIGCGEDIPQPDGPLDGELGEIDIAVDRVTMADGTTAGLTGVRVHADGVVDETFLDGVGTRAWSSDMMGWHDPGHLTWTITQITY